MSATSRILRGSSVTWLRLAISIAAQLLVTPMMLAYWSPEVFGVWLAMLSAVAFLQLPGICHQEFIGNELLRNVTTRRRVFTRVLRSGVLMGLAYSCLEISVAGILASTLPEWLNLGETRDKHLAHLGGAFFFLTLGSGLVWNWGGIWVRAATANGCYARCAWWGVADGLVKVGVPLIVLPLGAGVFGAALALMLSVIALHLVTLVDLIRAAQSALVVDVRPKWRLGLRNFVCSQVLTLKSSMEMLRQQGARLILSPLAGAGEMAAFATMRTGANVALQGLGTITGPLMPELMRFLNQRDQARSEAAFGVVWFAVAGGMAPVVVVVQAVAPPLFELWTHGKIAFDPVLFAMLSLGVLIFALAQPAMALVQGHNLLRSQTLISMTSGLVAVGGMFLLVPRIGIRGAALALVIAEVVALAGYVWSAALWMSANGLVWPYAHLRQVSASVAIAGAAMFALSLWPTVGITILACTLVLLSGCLWMYWRSFPEIAKARIQGLVLQRLAIFHRIAQR